MINAFWGLATAGFLSVWYGGARFQKILSAIAAVFLAAVLYGVNHHYQLDVFSKISRLWISSRYHPINLDFSFTKESASLLLPLLMAALLNTLLMIWDNFERQKLYVFALSSLSLAALIMIICGQNTIQILTGACFVDILGFCVINNIAARRQYIFYNLLADLGLFMAFAMQWGACRGNLLSQLALCGDAKNLIALWLIVISACVKSSLFPFQGYFMPTAVLSESRRGVLSFLSTPVAGFLILYKIYPLLPTGFAGTDLFRCLGILSVIWGTVGGVLISRQADKKLYMNLILYGLFYIILSQNGEKLPTALGLLPGIHLLLNHTLTETRRYVAAVFICVLLQLGAVVAGAEEINAAPWTVCYLGGVMLVVGSLFYGMGAEKREENNLLKLLVIFAVSCALLYGRTLTLLPATGWLGAACLLMLLRPYRIFCPLYESEKLQNADVFSEMFYFIFVSPVLFLGRILWLTIDFLIIERTLLSSLSEGYGVLSRLFNWLHSESLRNVLFFMAAGFALICYICFGGR